MAMTPRRTGPSRNFGESKPRVSQRGGGADAAATHSGRSWQRCGRVAVRESRRRGRGGPANPVRPLPSTPPRCSRRGLKICNGHGNRRILVSGLSRRVSLYSSQFDSKSTSVAVASSYPKGRSLERSQSTNSARAT